MTELLLDALTEDAVLARSDADGEPDWVRDLRLAGLKRYVDQAWPQPRGEEAWRHTPFKRFDVSLPIAEGVASTEAPDTGLLGVLAPSAGQLRIVDAQTTSSDLVAEVAARGVILADLAAATRDHADLVRAHLGRLSSNLGGGLSGGLAGDDRTISANDTAWTSGAFLHVPAEVEVANPIGIHIHVTEAAATLPRALIVLDHHARATVYLEHTSTHLDQPTTVDEVVEVVLGEGARLDLVSLQEWNGRIGHLSLQKAELGRNATLRHLTVTFGGETVRLRPEVDLAGEGASCAPLGLFVAGDGQHFDIQPTIRHLAPHATSDVLFKGAVQGRARSVFRGNVYVGPNAIGTNSQETNKTLVLTDGARADSTPFLEIECSDVKCGHGSATGQLDEDALFYLQARGIPRPDAVRMVVFGFFEEVVDRIDLPGVRARASAHIAQEIESADLSSFGVRR